MRIVRRLAMAYLAMDLVHFGDHLRQGRSLGAAIYTLGTAGLIAAIAFAVLAIRNHPVLPLAAAALGSAFAVGLIAVHLAPRWSTVFSDSYQVLNLDWISWAIVYLRVAVAAALAIAGVRELRPTRSLA